MSSAVPPTSSSHSGRELERVWTDFGDQLRRRARTRLRQYGLSGQTESMDVCNDVMVDLAKRRDNPASVEEALAYINRAIDNQVTDTFRALARQCRDFRRNENAPVDEIGLASQSSTASQVALRKEIIEKVRSLLDPDDARALDLMLENREWNEIGELLQIKPDTVRMRVRRAIEKVRSTMPDQTL